MKSMAKLKKLHKGEKVAVLSPSFAAPGRWPHVYELGLKRIREVFELEPVEFAVTRKLGASKEERAKDLVDAFEDNSVSGVFASLGGNDQVTYIKNLPTDSFTQNSKPYFGFSDNTHFMNFLWLQGVPSFYGGAVLTQFAMQKRMDEYTINYLRKALFEEGEVELKPSDVYNDMGLTWNDPQNLDQERTYEPNDGWSWDGKENTTGITWGGCLESIDEMLRHGVPVPSLEDFENVVLMTETSQEIPSSAYVHRVYRALGERGILTRVKGVLVGRPKAWEFNNQQTTEQKKEYRQAQRDIILATVREYNATVPVIQNLDFGHTDPQIPMPYGMTARIDSGNKKIFVEF